MVGGGCRIGRAIGRIDRDRHIGRRIGRKRDRKSKRCDPADPFIQGNVIDAERRRYSYNPNTAEL